MDQYIQTLTLTISHSRLPPVAPPPTHAGIAFGLPALPPLPPMPRAPPCRYVLPRRRPTQARADTAFGPPAPRATPPCRCACCSARARSRCPHALSLPAAACRVAGHRHIPSSPAAACPPVLPPLRADPRCRASTLPEKKQAARRRSAFNISIYYFQHSMIPISTFRIYSSNNLKSNVEPVYRKC